MSNRHPKTTNRQQRRDLQNDIVNKQKRKQKVKDRQNNNNNNEVEPKRVLLPPYRNHNQIVQYTNDMMVIR
jgi:hypothetical protein